ncbi:MAG: four helix bundle protein [Acidobacteriaceae bacterium]|nr:four helix bundle protein [Acidobacteriaceae bacterium]
MKNFRELKVWQKAHGLTLNVYRISAKLPREEMYGLAAQLRRSSSSIPANLAEGCGRNGELELRRFCSIAMGSVCELSYHLQLARDLNWIENAEYEHLAEQADEVQRMLSKLMSTLTKSIATSPRAKS